MEIHYNRILLANYEIVPMKHFNNQFFPYVLLQLKSMSLLLFSYIKGVDDL